MFPFNVQMTAIKNLSPLFSITDESLIQVHVNTCKLLIEIDNGEFSFAILNNKSNRFLAYRSYEYENRDTIDEILFNDDLLQQKEFDKTVFSIVNEKSTLVPNAFYDDEKKTELLLFNHEIEADESIARDDFRLFEAKNIFAINDDILHFIEKNFQNPLIHHCSTPLIESTLLRNKNRSQPYVNANIHKKQFELTVIDNNQLQYYNAFHCNTTEDFIYYILFMYEQLELNAETVALELSGKIQRHSPFHAIAARYIRNVEFAARSVNSEFSYGFENLPSHFCPSLFELNLCES